MNILPGIIDAKMPGAMFEAFLGRLVASGQGG